jgi:hypothetical protein
MMAPPRICSALELNSLLCNAFLLRNFNKKEPPGPSAASIRIANFNLHGRGPSAPTSKLLCPTEATVELF